MFLQNLVNLIIAVMDLIHSLVHSLSAALALVLVQQDQTQAVHVLLQTLILLYQLSILQDKSLDITINYI